VVLDLARRAVEPVEAQASVGPPVATSSDHSAAASSSAVGSAGFASSSIRRPTSSPTGTSMMAAKDRLTSTNVRSVATTAHASTDDHQLWPGGSPNACRKAAQTG
jgi:hypothetical protein